MFVKLILRFDRIVLIICVENNWYACNNNIVRSLSGSYVISPLFFMIKLSNTRSWTVLEAI